MHKQDHEDRKKAPRSARPVARNVARELSSEEISAVSGGRPITTHQTGPGGDDPADPGETS